MATLTPLSADAWNLRQARHLLNRAGFGLPEARARELAAMAPEAAVDSMVAYPVSETADTPDFILPPVQRGDLKRMNPEMDDAALILLNQERQREERTAVGRLQSWWLERMYTTANPLEEKMALFWHGHFATSAQKVKASYHNYQIYEIFRRNATGNFKTLALCVGQSPAMLQYLDNKNSSLKEPNENWARELMELFTMGVGNYTEQDIKESARSFTGWTCDQLAFHYAPKRHDDGEKTFLGKTGNFHGWDIIEIIFEQPVTARFIAGKIWTYFAGAPGEATVIDGLAQTLRENNYELRPMLTELFRSEAFHTDAVTGNQIKSPAQYVLELCHDLGVDPPYPALARAMRVLGQDLFYPPNVKGWDGNRAWINANTLLIRANLPAVVVNPDGPGAPPSSDTMAGAALPMGKGANAMPEMAAAAGGVAPSPEERKEYQRVARQQAMEKLRLLPQDVRKAKVEQFRNAKPPERMAMMKELGVAPPPWRTHGPGTLFDGMSFFTAGACIDQLADRFLATAPGVAQRKGLLEVMGATEESAKLSPRDLDDGKRLALLRLVTSMAEYQLC